MLAKKMWRDVRKNFSQYLTIFLMLLIGIGVYSGIESYMLGMKKTADNFYTDYNLEDLIVVGTNFTNDDLEKIQDLENVKDAELKFVTNATTSDDKQLLLSSISKNNISKFYIYDGEEFDNEPGVWLDNYFAIENNLKVGDEVTIKIAGFETKQKIRALINVPDHLYDVRDASELVPDRKQFGFAYIASDILPTKIYNNIMVDVDNADKKADTKNQILEAVPNAVAVMNVEDIDSYARYQGEIDEGKTYVGVFSGIFLFIALLSVVTTMTRVIKKERSQIGTMKALGFSNRRILMHYMSYGFLLSIVAGLLGILLGKVLIGGFFMKIEMSLFAIPEGGPVIDPSTWLVYIIVVLLVTGISYLVCRKISKENPAETLKAEKVTARNSKLNFANSKLGFITKWNLRDISRNRLRTIMGVAGVTGCAMMIVVAFGMLDSMNYFVDLQFTKLYNFDYKLVVADDTTNTRIKELTDKYGDDTSKTLMIEIKNGDYTDANNALVIDTDDKIRFVDSHSEIIKQPNNDGVYITRKLAEKYNLGVGDTISWHIMGSSDYYDSEIIGLNKDPQNQNITMNREYLESLGVPYIPDAIYLDGELSEKEISGISAIQKRNDLREGMDEMISRIKMMVVLIIVVAVVLGVVIIYNLGVLSFTEKQYQFATLKVLGFSDRKIRQIFVRQNNWIAIISICLGLPFGFFLTDFLFTMSLEETYDFNAHITVATYVIAAIGTFVVSWLVSNLLARKIKKIDMVSSLKADE